MGAAVASQSAVIGGQSDPARSTQDNSGGMYNSLWMPIPPNHGTTDTWYCVGYHHNGSSPPTQTWVAFAKQKGTETSVTINGATFDLSGVSPGEWMLYTAFADGTAANPWQVTYAISVFRGTSGCFGNSSAFPVLAPANGKAYDFATLGGTTTVTLYDQQDTPFPSTYDTIDGPVYDPLNINAAGGSLFTTGVYWGDAFGPVTGKGYAAFTFVVGSAGLTYTGNAWVPDGLGASGSQPPNSWFQSQGVAHQWGLPDQTNLQCRVISLNDQDGNIYPAGVQISAGGTKNFIVQTLVQDYTIEADNLTPIAAQLSTEGGTGVGAPSYGTNDLLASKVRPDFIDQALEAAGGIFLYS